MLCNNRRDTDILRTKVCSKRSECLFNMGVLVVRDTKTGCTANTLVLAKSQLFTKPLLRSVWGSNKSLSLAGQRVHSSAMSAQHTREGLLPKVPWVQWPGTYAGNVLCASTSPGKRRVDSNKSQLLEGQVIASSWVALCRKFAIPLSQRTF